ncbi:aldo keto reductase family [Cyclospora cayetanensis]|uniref:Aldo keto reductase family n=1 Tax=Cyclospora cayetanensis TaxID=88456 RepID=A0A1D3CZ21_9EIME|nr:aldo keto reductase family [Cyclospora cayetanensis]
MAAPGLAGTDLLASAKCHTLHNGVSMPLLGLGTWRLHGNKLRGGVFGALQEQYGLIDTASVYENEAEIRELLKEAGNPRVFLTSKLQPKDAQGTEAVLRAFDGTIQRLGVDQLDLYLIHWPGSSGVDTSDPENLQLSLTVFLLLCGRLGLMTPWLRKPIIAFQVRAIGVSNFMVTHLENLMEDGAKIMPMIEWHPMCWVPELIPFAKKHNITLQAYSSLGSGENRLLEHPVVKEIAKEIQQPPSVVLLRWALQQGLLVIPCSTSQEHLRENARIFDVQLSDDQMNKLSSIHEEGQHRFCWNPHKIA